MTDTPHKTTRQQWLVLGGTRSGKSRFAESKTTELAQQTATNKAKLPPVFYIATSTAVDDEMQQRIDQHRQQRPQQWQTIECPFDLAQTLQNIQFEHPDAVVMIDCLTLWLTNQLLGREPDYTAPEPQICLEQWWQAKQDLLDFLTQSSLTIIMVSNEVGQGITPLGKLSRTFVDEAGRLHQDIAELINHVVMVVAGLPMTLKSMQ